MICVDITVSFTIVFHPLTLFPEPLGRGAGLRARHWPRSRRCFKRARRAAGNRAEVHEFDTPSGGHGGKTAVVPVNKGFVEIKATKQ